MIYSFVSITITVLFLGTVIKVLFADIDWIELLGISFLLGIGIETIIFFTVIAQLDSVYPHLFWLMKAIETISTVIILSVKKPQITIKISYQQLLSTSWSGVFWVGIMLLFTLSLIYTLYYPVHTTDSIYYYDFRSKIMYLSHTVSGISIISNWSYYPMFTSMVGLISRFCGNNNPSFYYPLMFASFALVFYSCLRRLTNSQVASFFTFLMYSTPLLYWQSRLDGMTNIPYSIFLGVGFIFASQFFSVRSHENLRFYYFSILGLALSRWVRIQEPFWVIPLVSVLIKVILEKKWIHLFIGMAIFYAITSTWPNYVHKTINTMHGVNTSVSVSNAISTILEFNALPNNTNRTTRLKNIVSRLELVFTKTTTIIYKSLLPISALFVCSLFFLLFIRINVSTLIPLLYILLSWALFTTSVFYGTYVWSWMLELDNSYSRLASFFVPLICYFLVALLVNLYPKLKRSHQSVM